VRALDRRFVDEHAVAALLWDVDGTLMAYHATQVAAELRPTLEALARDGVPQAILSNCGEDRFLELGTIFPELPILKAYTTETGSTVLRSLRGGEERWMPAPRPAGALRPCRKPSAALVDFAIDRLGSPPRDRVFMVGDQYFTDIAGANLAGIRSVKVPTLCPSTFPLAIRSFQRIERLLYGLINE
jgi:predicted HAD superfamily phosphohydrolase YqeG